MARAPDRRRGQVQPHAHRGRSRRGDDAHRYGLVVLVPLTLLFAPLVFSALLQLALVEIALWEHGMGVDRSIVPAAVATMVPAKRRASALAPSGR